MAMTEDELVEWVGAKIWDEGNVLDQIPALARAIIAKVRAESMLAIDHAASALNWYGAMCEDLRLPPSQGDHARIALTNDAGRRASLAIDALATLTPSETKEGSDG